MGTTRSPRLLLLAGLALLVAGSPASAAKWVTGCPKPKEYLSAIGKGLLGRPLPISRYYEHQGHEITIRLKFNDVINYGGFSTDPDGNTVEITYFPPGGGAPIAMPPIPVTAASADA